MNLTSYRYTGPPSGVELRLPDGTYREVQLYPGRLVDLPGDHEYIQTLIALQRLEPMAGQPNGTRRTRKKEAK